MELALNLLWALICALTLCLWAWQAYAQRQERRVLVRGTLLLVGVLVILFPYISVTDDLQATEFVEDSSYSARKSRTCAANHGWQSDAPTAFLSAVCPLVAPSGIAVESV
ncbi:MAG TPA: hypothetical protein VGQ94_03920, partial [Terriglobales bacterium]|nr:hypothetical protein [Terriglobales bacterium]